MFKRGSLTILALILCWPSAASAADFTGQVIGVLDGDTIEVLHNQNLERIRFSGIDCPEKGLAWNCGVATLDCVLKWYSYLLRPVVRNSALPCLLDFLGAFT